MPTTNTATQLRVALVCAAHCMHTPLRPTAVVLTRAAEGGEEDGGAPPAQTWPPLCAVRRVPVLSRVARAIFPPCGACGMPLPLSGVPSM
jgi:hypothetical protein